LERVNGIYRYRCSHALSDKKNKNHKRAVLYFKTAVKRGVIFLLGKHVLVEYIDGVAKCAFQITGIFQTYLSDSLLKDRNH
jgi:predicted nucleic acid-binding protein